MMACTGWQQVIIKLVQIWKNRLITAQNQMYQVYCQCSQNTIKRWNATFPVIQAIFFVLPFKEIVILKEWKWKFLGIRTEVIH